MKFEHFIITRFNLPIYSKIKNGNVCSTMIEYLDNRFLLFLKYCLPSIKQQTCQDFKWLVLFDANTPKVYKTKINEIHKEYNRFIPCYLDLNEYENVDKNYIDYYNDYISKLGNYNYESIEYNIEEYNRMIITPQFISDCIHKHSENDVDFYITTRIDNDDALHKDFIKKIQDEAIKENRYVLFDYINGYRYVLDKRFVTKMRYQNGHFTTLIEPKKKSLQSVVYWDHNQAYKFVPTKHIDIEPMYIELIHKTNVINNEKDISLHELMYAVKNFRHSEFGYPRIRLAASIYIKTFLRLFYTYTKNYLTYHLSLNKIIK